MTNGEVRPTVEVPIHDHYNPPGSSSSALARAGSQVFGDGFAGRPIRMPDNAGKKIEINEKKVFMPS